MERKLNLDELETILHTASTIKAGALKEREEKINAIAKQSELPEPRIERTDNGLPISNSSTIGSNF